MKLWRNWAGNVVVRMNDILVTTETLELHVDVLKEVFMFLINNTLKLTGDICFLIY